MDQDRDFVIRPAGEIAAAIAEAGLDRDRPVVASCGSGVTACHNLLAIAHAGVRIGRKTYMVDMAGGTKRTDYTAVSNTVIGFLLLAVGGISSGVAMLGNDWALLVLGMMGATGVVSARLLKEV